MTEKSALSGELLDDEALDLQELAQACAVAPDWVVEHVQAGLLSCTSASGGEMRFASAQLGSRAPHRDHRAHLRRQPGAGRAGGRFD